MSESGIELVLQRTPLVLLVSCFSIRLQQLNYVFSSAGIFDGEKKVTRKPTCLFFYDFKLEMADFQLITSMSLR